VRATARNSANKVRQVGIIKFLCKKPCQA